MLLFILDVAFILAFISRWHGGGWNLNAPHGLKAAAWALPFAVAPLAAGHWIGAAVSLAASWGGKATGHGRGQSLKEPLAGSPERIEVLTKWAVNKLPVYWYKAFILLVSGILGTSGGVIGFLWLGDFVSAFAVLVGGALKPVAYIIGWTVRPHQEGKPRATEIGEFLTGAFAGVSLAIAVILARGGGGNK